MRLQKALTVLVAVFALGVNHLSAREPETGEWSVRLMLTSDIGELEDNYNRLGQFHDATTGFDTYDLHELDQTWEGTYLSVIFYRPDWETDRETFNTDYHPLSSIGPGAGCALESEIELGDEWTFEVRSDDIYRDLSISWVGTGTDMEHMVLVDEEEGNIVPAVVDGVTQAYDFRMNGAVREFTWRLLTKDEYEEFLASGELSPFSAEAVATVRSALTGSEGGSARSVATDQPATSKERPKSGWLPRGWGQGEGKGYHRQPVPDGLPADPFAD